MTTSKPITKTCSLCGQVKENKGFHGNRCGVCRRAVWGKNALERGDSRELLNLRSKKKLMEEKEYVETLISQGGVCAICKKPESQKDKFGVIKNLAIDHCHSYGTTRGLLCSWCNVGLGYFKDSPDNLRSALEYLARHS